MKLYCLADESFPEGIKRRPGVYIVHAQTTTGAFQHLPRLLGHDPDGILFIGQSKNVRRRVATLKRAMTIREWRKVPHSEGRTYRWVPALRKEFPIDRLYVSVRYTDTPEDQERRQITEYARRLGEVPPLNLSVGQNTGRRRKA